MNKIEVTYYSFQGDALTRHTLALTTKRAINIKCYHSSKRAANIMNIKYMQKNYPRRTNRNPRLF